MSEPKPERVTAQRLDRLDSKARAWLSTRPKPRGNRTPGMADLWAQAVSDLVDEVRRLRGLLVDWHATYAHEPDDLMTAGEERALLAEAQAIVDEKP